MDILNSYLSSEVLAVVSGIIILALFAIAIALPQGSKASPPGHKGHRPIEEDIGHEEIRGDGFIDSFSGEIEEAGGGMPPVVKLALLGVLLWWLLYLILNWANP
jgi:hypothetical protein